MNFNTEEQLLEYTEYIKGKTFGQIDREGLLKIGNNDKGVLGKVVETGFYGYKLNSDAKADFDNLGIELKVTGYIVNKDGSKTPKERLSLSMINYNAIINEEFEFSKLLFKNRKMLIIWYEYIKGINYSDFQITEFQLYDMTPDIEVIKNDFYLIRNKVQVGQAHLLSEGDTTFLGAATKGSKNSVCTQPNSPIIAKPRAFCLKNSYMRGVLRNPNLKYISPVKEIKTVEEYILNKLQPFINLSQADIWKKVSGKNVEDYKVIPYQLNKLISNKIIGSDETLKDNNDLFNKTECVIKNLPVKSNLYPIERLTYRNIRLSEFEHPWEESQWKVYFEEMTFLIILYEGDKHGYRKLKTVKKVTFTPEEVAIFGQSYNMIRETIATKDVTKLPYPKSFSEQLLEIAPKGKAGARAYQTFFDQDMPKVCFMLNKDFIYKKIKDSSIL